jgi:hypothetical protein
MMTHKITGPAETEASHEVMQLVRGNPPLNRWVLQLRDNGLSWRDVKAAIAEKKKERDAINRSTHHAISRHASTASGDPCPQCQRSVR